MGKVIDLSGKTFGRLTVVRFAGLNKHKKSLWECACKCGKMSIVLGHSLAYGCTKSCGCLHKEDLVRRSYKHGMSKKGNRHPLYKIWLGMKNRCSNQNDYAYKYWGGRGIKVCNEWLDSFEQFLADMGERPHGFTLERVNNDGDYEKTNCVWASRAEQCRNNRRAKLTKVKAHRIIEFLSVGIPTNQLAVLFGVSDSAIRAVGSGKTWRTITERAATTKKISSKPNCHINPS